MALRWPNWGRGGVHLELVVQSLGQTAVPHVVLEHRALVVGPLAIKGVRLGVVPVDALDVVERRHEEERQLADECLLLAPRHVSKRRESTMMHE